MKRVLLLGSGYVSGPVVEYLTRDEKTQVTVGKFVKFSLCLVCSGSELVFFLMKTRHNRHCLSQSISPLNIETNFSF